MNTHHRILFACTAAAGGLVAALSSSAVANADLWSIDPEPGSPPEVVSVSGIPPFDLTATEEGYFGITDHLSNGGFATDYVRGVLDETQSTGFANQLLVSTADFNPSYPTNSVVDITNFGGYENVYIDAVGQGAQGSNEITDTLVTPFGSFDIPTTFDASAFLSLSEPGAAAAVEADWATLISDFGALL